MFRSPYKYFWLTFLLIVIDQIIKLAIYHFLKYEGNEVPIIGDFVKLHYVLNKGMAFGITLDFLPKGYSKIVLSLFRVFAMVGIGYYLTKLAKKNAHEGLLWSIAAILGGAIGNVIDSTFYGVLLHNAPYDSPTPWFHGQVIDMFFFDFYQGWIPEWVPVWGGSWYSTPIFNFADAAIFCGVMAIMIWQNTFFASLEPKPAPVAPSVDVDMNAADTNESVSSQE
ncbi:lipoprotein signal peptidase [Flectobacillus roseus]|uniref:Lipoprotein signal peptidase n=1 Tax=Flectobacillus roseus TaxID=502259 RepID=A0ABT6Y5B2_9BACT|nr:lipoprotein signal peptidase [Flectobacillus roseus]MDI9858755.1 lipoprotein signal peptidase [Flectobacillus roseus]